MDAEIPADSCQVLVVDDDPGVARVLTRVARDLGFEAAAVTAPDQVVSQVERLGPDLILLDLSMPGLDGVEILRALAARQSGVQVCLVSGAERDVLDAARDLGDELGHRMVAPLHTPLVRDQIEGTLQTIERAGVGAGPGRPQPRAADLEAALRNGEFVPHYQPKLDLASGRITGVEVLSRWNSPDFGAVSPGTFIPMAEASGAIQRLTDAIARRALAELSDPGGAFAGLGIALNLSPRLLHDLAYPDRLLELVRGEGVDPDRVTLEVTESEAMSEPARYLDILVRFRLKGFHLSVDDFGTGFSSLVQLYKLPFEEIKIDRTFVADIRESQDARVIVKAMVGLGRGLGLSVVAEGIEDAETADALRSYGCDLGQGYYFSRPCGIDDLRKLELPD
ncbi:MAG: EAL domain-containing response regulator [Myxococcota bacterium]|nr:EAL domain-containing response regulator [Myxococcota bacterium]